MEDSKEYIVNDVKIHIGLMGNGLGMAKGHTRVGKEVPLCPICRKEITDKERTYFILGNHKVIPNSWIHEHCAKREDIEVHLKRLANSYKRYLSYKNIWDK